MKKLLHGIICLLAAFGHRMHADPIAELEKLGKHLLPASASVSTQDQKKTLRVMLKVNRQCLANYQAEKKRLEEENRTNAPAITTELEETPE